MSLLAASKFKVTVWPNRPGVSVLYKPTRRRYTYTAVADQGLRRGVLAPGFCVDRAGAEFGGYDNSEIQKHARKLALAMAEKIFCGAGHRDCLNARNSTAPGHCTETAV